MIAAQLELLGTPTASKSGMSGLLQNLDTIAHFFQPNIRSTTLTIVSKKSGTRFTYDVKRKEPKEGSAAEDVWYVDLLNGPNNRKDFTALAVLTKRAGKLVYHHASKSRVSVDAPSAVAFKFAVEHVVVKPNKSILDHVEFWHEGRCGKCGNKLTVPESIARGLGPECAKGE